MEVSLFGPGYGECVVLHLGHGEWVIIDSCISAAASDPAPIHYLASIGVDPDLEVGLVVATHWHDDHIRGMARTLAACGNARFVASSALRHEEFLAMVQMAEGVALARSSSGVREYRGVIEELRSRRTDRPELAGPSWAIAGRTLWRRRGALPGRVESLSPSDASINLSLRHLAKVLPEVGAPVRRIMPQEPNQTAVVLRVEVGAAAVLLGADLVDTGEASTGWSAVVSSQDDRENRAAVFKVPHHGGSSGHHPEVWDRMLRDDPMALLTPWNRGGRALPTQEDLERLTGLAKEVYMTAPTRSAAPRLPPQVRRAVREATRSFSIADPDFGHVRIRADLAASELHWRCDLFGTALRVPSSGPTTAGAPNAAPVGS